MKMEEDGDAIINEVVVCLLIHTKNIVVFEQFLNIVTNVCK